MRGLIYTEYFDFVTSEVGDQILEDVLSELEGTITGAYTSVGNYSFAEFASIHKLLSAKLGASPEDLARQFGVSLLHRFKTLFPAYFVGVESGIAFLEKVGAHIHEEVKKLYPDANPPTVDIEYEDGNPAFLVYRSHRPLAAVAEGLASECLRDFGDAFKLGPQLTVGEQVKFPLEPIHG